jgi:hypothetical protein
MIWAGIVGQVVYLYTSDLPIMVCGTSSTAAPFIAAAVAAVLSDPGTRAVDNNHLSDMIVSSSRT